MAGRTTLVTTTTTSYHEEYIDLDTELEKAAVMKQRVSKSTRDGYKRRNILFMIWLFDIHRKYPNILEPNIYDDFKTHDVMDKERTTRNRKQ